MGPLDQFDFSWHGARRASSISLPWSMFWSVSSIIWWGVPEHAEQPLSAHRRRDLCSSWRYLVNQVSAELQKGELFLRASLVTIDFLIASLCTNYLSLRWNTKAIVTFATILQVGGVASSLVLKPTVGLIMDVARGFPYYPNDSNASMGLPNHLLVGLVWLAGCVLTTATIVYRDGGFSRVNLAAILRRRYSRIPNFDRHSQNGAKKEGMSPPKEVVATSEAFNMFDPADLPPRLAEYANMVYSACEDLGNFFGFQDSSVRNQAEHLLILLSNNRRYMSSHILPPSVQPPSPIHALHAKVFSNYVKWCRAMSVPPHFSKMNASMSAPPAVASRVVDLVLYFCIWGEGSNLRHMPECTWFLYHKMMEEYIKSEGYTQTRSLYAGHFLDHVVEPIYRVAASVRKVHLRFLILGHARFFPLTMYLSFFRA